MANGIPESKRKARESHIKDRDKTGRFKEAPSNVILPLTADSTGKITKIISRHTDVSEKMREKRIRA